MSAPLRVFYGGSFDPVHNGHLAIARAARDALHAEVALLPARDPPHKAATHADAEQRAQLLELAIEGEPGLHVDRRELQRAGPSYTVDTLAGLRAELGGAAPLAWLIGADSLLQLHTWHRWREVFDERWESIQPLGFDERFKRMWDYHLASCEGGFRAGNIDVGQFRLTRA